MNKIYWILFAASLLFVGCSKSESITTEAENATFSRMRSHFSNELKCTTPGMRQTNLFRGIYEGQTVYYVAIVCPNCNTLPPRSGYTDTLEEIVFADFRNVTDSKTVYDSCTKKYSE